MLPLVCIKKSPVLAARKMRAVCLSPPWRGGKVCCVGKTELWTGRVGESGWKEPDIPYMTMQIDT